MKTLYFHLLVLSLGAVGLNTSVAAPPAIPATRISFDQLTTKNAQKVLIDEYHTQTLIPANFVASPAVVVNIPGKLNKALVFGFYDPVRLVDVHQYAIMPGKISNPTQGVSYNYANGFSLSVWIKPGKNVSGALRYILSKGENSAAGEQDMALSLIGNEEPGNAGLVRFQMQRDGQNYQLTSTGVPPLDKWTHVTVTCGNSGFRLFLNGNLHDSQVNCPYFTLAHVDTGRDLIIGANDLNSSNGFLPFLGALDELLIYERELTAAEVKSVSSRNFLFLQNYDLSVGTTLTRVFADESGEGVVVSKVGANVKHIAAFNGNALSFADSGAEANSGNYLKLTSGLSLVNKTQFTIGLSISPNRNLTYTTPKTLRVMSQNIVYENGTTKGVFEIAMIPHPTVANTNVMRFKLNINGTFYTTTALNTRVNAQSWGYFQFSFDGRCIRIKPGGGTTGGSAKCVPGLVAGQVLPVKNSSISTLPIVVAGGWKAKLATPTTISFSEGFNGKLDDVSVHVSGTAPRPETICTNPGALPVLISATPIPDFAGEVVRYRWKEYNSSVPASGYFLNVQSLTSGVPNGLGFGTNTTNASCFFDNSGQRVCQMDVVFPYSASGPNYQWRIKVNPGAGRCMNSNYSQPQSFTYFSP